jgi:NAD(P)H-dependent FMN reductase
MYPEDYTAPIKTDSKRCIRAMLLFCQRSAFKTHPTRGFSIIKATLTQNVSLGQRFFKYNNMATPKKIGVIIGSMRQNRIGDKVSALIKSILEAAATNLPSQPTFSLVDIASFNLPVFDEAILPALVPSKGQFAREHSKAWSAEIRKYDGYVFVTAEWNFGLPGGTKNAIDFLYDAWIGKPVMIVSYGIMGGMSASDHLKATLGGMHLQVVDTRVSLTFPDADPTNHNMSPGLIGAMSGELIEPVAEKWKMDAKEDLLKGYGELQSKLG